MSWNFYPPYVSVAARRAKAAKHAQKLAKNGTMLSPVKIAGRTIASTFWGKAWCTHLESFSDYENRLPRGRTYVRNGSVLDVQLAPGKVTALIMGSSLYRGAITIAPLKRERWKAIKAECAGKIDSLVGLLQGRLSDAVMRIITDRDKGLFPQPSEIKFDCSCPDSASLCKHLAAVLYGVGARLDTQPELLFVLRGVDHLELIGAATNAAALVPTDAGAMNAAELSDVFGIDIEPADSAPPPEKGQVKRVGKGSVKRAFNAGAKGQVEPPTKSGAKGTGKKAAVLPATVPTPRAAPAGRKKSAVLAPPLGFALKRGAPGKAK